MTALRLISTTAAILLLGASVVTAQEMKTDETPGVPAAQQNTPPEKMAPAKNSDQMKAPEASGATAPTGPETANKQTMDKEAPASAAAKTPHDSVGGLDVKSKRTERHARARYASRHHGPLYNSYMGAGYRHCHRHSWMPWLWC